MVSNWYYLRTKASGGFSGIKIFSVRLLPAFSADWRDIGMPMPSLTAAFTPLRTCQKLVDVCGQTTSAEWTRFLVIFPHFFRGLLFTG